MSRMEINALSTLVDSSEAAGYTLPAELTDAWRTYQRLKAATVEIPPALEADTAAARIVSTAAAGGDLNLTAAALEVETSRADRLTAELAVGLLGRAAEQAANTTAMLAADLADRIITEHLRPAMEDVWTQAREVATDLGGHGLDPYALITAPAKARNAYAKLPTLVARRTAIQSARRKVNAIGYRTAEHDDRALYADFRKPLAFHPHWRTGAPIPLLPYPKDATECLLWFVSDEAAKAEPWFPTIAEQDKAWWDQFGEGQSMRKQAHSNGLAVGARIG